MSLFLRCKTRGGSHADSRSTYLCALVGLVATALMSVLAPTAPAGRNVAAATCLTGAPLCLLTAGALVRGGAAIPQAATARVGLAELARTTNGAVYWYGHELLPPFTVETDSTYTGLWFRVDHIPEFHQLGLTRVPLHVPTKEQAQRAAQNQTVPADVRRDFGIDSLARVASFRVASRGGSDSAEVAGAVAEYLRHPDAVVDAAPTTKRSWYVVWRRNMEKEEYDIVPRGNRRPAPGEVITSGAHEMVESLARGSVIIFRENGVETVMPSRESAAIRAEIQALRNGTRTTSTNPLLQDLVPELRAQPTPILTLLARVP